MDTSRFFDAIFENAKTNSVLILNQDGIVLQVNQAFTNAFGYTNEDIVGKNFSILFTSRDQVKQLPESELQMCLTEGFANDNNYVVHKDGSTIWVTGESVLARQEDAPAIIIKIIHNIHAQKLLERFLMEANVFVESLFESIKDTALLVIDTRMKIVKANPTFCQMFDIDEKGLEGTRLSDLSHSFWSGAELQQKLREVVVTHQYLKSIAFDIQTAEGADRKLEIQCKYVDGHVGIDKRILLVINDITGRK